MPDSLNNLAQNEEWFELRTEAGTRRLRFHDYSDIYAVPGLYESLFYETLECNSPEIVCNLIADAMDEFEFSFEDLRVLDVGAGNGMVGERLAEAGADHLIAIDIIEAAATATERDRPEVYADYLVADLTALEPAQKELLSTRKLNCLVTVAALGFDDIPPQAFAEAYNVVEPGGLIAFCLKEDMVSGEDSSGFSRLIDEALVEGAIELKAERRYRHRLAANGDPLHYVAMVGQKKADLPAFS